MLCQQLAQKKQAQRRKGGKTSACVDALTIPGCRTHPCINPGPTNSPSRQGFMQVQMFSCQSCRITVQGLVQLLTASKARVSRGQSLVSFLPTAQRTGVPSVRWIRPVRAMLQKSPDCVLLQGRYGHWVKRGRMGYSSVGIDHGRLLGRL